MRSHGPNGANRTKRGPNGPTRADFLHAEIFLFDENIMFCKPGTKTKIGRAMGILSLFVSLSEENF